MHSDNFARLADQIISGNTSGFTLELGPHGEALPVTTGFAVGGDPRYTEVRIKNVGSASPRHVETMVRALSESVTQDVRPMGCSDQTASMAVGGWVYEGDLYLDATTVIADRDEAVRLATSRGELAIYDLSSGVEIMLSSTGLTN